LIYFEQQAKEQAEVLAMVLVEQAMAMVEFN